MQEQVTASQWSSVDHNRDCTVVSHSTFDSNNERTLMKTLRDGRTASLSELKAPIGHNI